MALVLVLRVTPFVLPHALFQSRLCAKLVTRQDPTLTFFAARRDTRKSSLRAVPASAARRLQDICPCPLFPSVDVRIRQYQTTGICLTLHGRCFCCVCVLFIRIDSADRPNKEKTPACLQRTKKASRTLPVRKITFQERKYRTGIFFACYKVTSAPGTYLRAIHPRGSCLRLPFASPKSFNRAQKKTGLQ